MIKIQRDWRARRVADKQKLEHLIQLWEKEKSTLKEYYMTNQGTSKNTSSPTKKNKTAASKLIMIPEDIKIDILKKYLFKQKTEFIICFIEQRLDFNPENFSPNIYKDLEMFKNSVKQQEKELFAGVKANDPSLEWISTS